MSVTVLMIVSQLIYPVASLFPEADIDMLNQLIEEIQIDCKTNTSRTSDSKGQGFPKQDCDSEDLEVEDAFRYGAPTVLEKPRLTAPVSPLSTNSLEILEEGDRREESSEEETDNAGDLSKYCTVSAVRTTSGLLTPNLLEPSVQSYSLHFTLNKWVLWKNETGPGHS